MKRREFLTGSLFAASAGFALDACAPGSDTVIPILVPEEAFVPGVESWHPTTCFECAAACGLLVRKIDGRLVKVEGNPEQPMSRGGVCARGQALPQAMYHPDRIRGPRSRNSAGEWAELSWDDAVARIAEALAPVGPEEATGRAAFLTGELNGHRLAIVTRFLKALHSPRHWVHEAFPTTTVSRAHERATGYAAPFDVAFDEARYVVSFGAEFLESHLSPVRHAAGLTDLRHARDGTRGKFVSVGPRLSLTAANADEWIPARPGSELDLVLALAFILIRDGRFDEAFSGSDARGFETFRAVVAERGQPESASTRSGVPVERLERLATEMATHAPAVALAGGAAVRGPDGLALASAVSHLNALLGAYSRGGALRFDVAAPAFAAWPRENDMPVQARALTSSETLEALDAEPPDVLFISGTNPLYDVPSGFGLREKLEAIPLIVSFASRPDETSQLADLILPESMSFERFDDAVPRGASAPLAGLSQPLLAASLYDTMSMPDSLIRIARAIGGTAAAAFNWGSYEQALAEAWAPIGFREALERGGTWEPPSEGGGSFSTADGCYHFDVAALEERDAAPPAVVEDELDLHVYASAALGDGSSADLPFLQELGDPITGVRWGSVVEINDVTAKALDIRHGETVEVRSQQGAVTLPAHLSAGIRPDVVAIAAGQGHQGSARFATGHGVNVFQLLEPRADSDGVLLTGTRVTLRKAQ